MTYRRTVPALLFLFIVLSACHRQPKRWIEILDPAARELIDSNAAIATVGSGYGWSEGPLYIAKGDYFLFSDVAGNTIYRWKEGGAVTKYLTPSGYTGLFPGGKHGGSNGLALNASGHLLLCQDGDRRVVRMDAPPDSPAPRFTVLADKFEGKMLNSPNDLVVARNGDIFFTDPTFGFKNGINDSLRALSFQAVYRLRPNGDLQPVIKDLQLPNGVALSADEKTLFIGNSDLHNMVWMQYALDGHDSIVGQKVFADIHPYEQKKEGNPDGLRCTRAGNVFAAGPDGIWIFSAAGKVIARIHTGGFTSNCAFSADEKTLLICAAQQVLVVHLK